MTNRIMSLIALGALAMAPAASRVPTQTKPHGESTAVVPRMLQEHQRIRAAVDKLRSVARQEHASGQVELADELAAHAKSEEEVLYPAAILVGDLIRARMSGKD